MGLGLESNGRNDACPQQSYLRMYSLAVRMFASCSKLSTRALPTFHSWRWKASLRMSCSDVIMNLESLPDPGSHVLPFPCTQDASAVPGTLPRTAGLAYRCDVSFPAKVASKCTLIDMYKYGPKKEGKFYTHLYQMLCRSVSHRILRSLRDQSAPFSKHNATNV